MAQDFDLSPEDWAHEGHYMANAGFSDLYRATIGTDLDGNPLVDLADTITTGFRLVTTGLEISPDKLAPNLAEFLAAAALQLPAARSEAMQHALANLSARFGFEIGPFER